jgi:hypothetical protein
MQPYAAASGKKEGKRRACSLSAASLCLFAGKKKKKRRSRKEKNKKQKEKKLSLTPFLFLRRRFLPL